jgi:hypothetical protein
MTPFPIQPGGFFAGLEGTAGHWKEDQGGQVGGQAAEGSSEGAVKVAEGVLLDRYEYIYIYIILSFFHSFNLSIYLSDLSDLI